MRDILFRGMTSDGRWVYGDLFHDGGKLRIGTLYSNDGSSVVIEETVGQYTGLTDKNGNKIFEGDVVEYQYVICDEDGVGMYESPVTFEDGCFCLDGDSDFTLSYVIWSSDEYGGLTVIGNIFDSNMEGNNRTQE